MYRRNRNHLAASILAAITMGVTSGSVAAGGLLGVDFDSANFSPASMATISNPYWPLSPDLATRTFTYIGDNDDECVVNKVFVDPAQIKSDFGGDYADIDAQVVLDREWVVELGENEACDANTVVGDDDLAELTYDWYAEDIFKNIWYMGEASRDFEEPCPSLDDVALGTPRVAWPDDELFLECTGGSWESGQPGQEEGEIIGQPGIVVPGDYPTGDKKIKAGTYYLQEVAEGAEDMAKIVRVNASLSVEDGVFPGEYENCRKVKEWNPFEPGASVEHKWYCKGGNGLVLIKGIGGGPTESEVLVDITTE